MRSITFYSYKGGVGRTLAMGNVAHYLAQLGQRVVAIDLDLEAPGLHYKLKPHKPPALGLLDLVSDFIECRRIRPVADWLYPVWESNAGGAIHLLPAGPAPASQYWRQFASVDWRTFLVGGDDRSDASGDGLAFFLELKQRIAQDTRPDFLLMDARTGITELGGIASSVLADDLVCFFVRNEESIDGTKEILDALIHSTRLTTSPLRIFPVLARLPELDEDDERIILADVSTRLALAAMPHVEPIMIVHSYPQLQVEERLLMTDDDPSVLESQLYADYARFFSSILPPAIAETSLQRSIEDAQKLAYKNPAEAEKILIRIAHRQPHILSYRALLEFYRLRSEKPNKLIDSAKKLAELSDDYGDELVWSTIVDSLGEIESDADIEALRFVERGWRARGSTDPDVGLRLADALLDIEDAERASAVLMSLAEATSSIKGELLAKIVSRLASMGAAQTALQLSSLVKRELRAPALLRAWARVVTSAESRDEAAELLARSDVNESLFRTRPGIWFDLLRLTGREELVLSAADRLAGELMNLIRADGLDGLASAVKQLYEEFAREGRGEQFVETLRTSMFRKSDRLKLKVLQRELERRASKKDVS